MTPTIGQRHQEVPGRAGFGRGTTCEVIDLDRAHAWYESAEYQAILPLRVNNSDGAAVSVDGVAEGYLASS